MTLNGVIDIPVSAERLMGSEAKAKSLIRYIKRRVKEGATDPRDAWGRLTKARLYRCLPELRPVEDRQAIAKLRHWLERNEAKIHQIAREEAELALRRAGIDVQNEAD